MTATAPPVAAPKVDSLAGLALGRVVLYRWGQDNLDHMAHVCNVFRDDKGKPTGIVTLCEIDPNGTTHSQYSVPYAGDPPPPPVEGAEPEVWPKAHTWRWPERA